MVYALTWLPAVLQAAGLKVAPVDGWESRGRAEMGQILGVLCHHTAGPKDGNMPSLRTLIAGRSDLPGPLAQLGLGRDGTYYVISAGRCNHAGKGSWRGVSRGNSHFIGIEAENTGKPDDPWPDVQLRAYERGVAAILRHTGRAVDDCAGHKEFAPGRKPDPSFEMNGFRQAVAAILDGRTEAASLIPAREPTSSSRPTLRRGASDPLVAQLQSKCGAAADGQFGAETEAAVRAFQRQHGLVPDGIVGPKTWAVFDAIAPAPMQGPGN